jgi:Ribbon-helix-helix protein, copG family
MTWCMKRMNIYLTEDPAAQLDRFTWAEGVSRAELIRELIDRGNRHSSRRGSYRRPRCDRRIFRDPRRGGRFPRTRDERCDHLGRLADS